MKLFGEDVLGKGVVIAKDTQTFGNRIGTYGLLVTLQEMVKRGYSIGEVDSVTGPLIGRPKSATFRTLDVVGLDTFVHVANNVYENVQEKSAMYLKYQLSCMICLIKMAGKQNRSRLLLKTRKRNFRIKSRNDGVRSS